MHTNQTSNKLIVDKLDYFPLPDSIKRYSFEKLDEVPWDTLGLPAHSSTFSVAEKQLYFEEDASGEVKVKKLNFTGQVLASVVLTPVDADVIVFLVFELYFCQGLLCDATLEEFKTQDKKEYTAGFEAFCAKMEKQIKRRTSFWFKWLYRPYFYLIRGIQFIFMMIFEKLLPIKNIN